MKVLLALLLFVGTIYADPIYWEADDAYYVPIQEENYPQYELEQLCHHFRYWAFYMSDNKEDGDREFYKAALRHRHCDE